jgi:hypothetical protein
VEAPAMNPAPEYVLARRVLLDALGTKRAEDKDALDVVRLLRGVDAKALAARLAALEVDPRSAAITTEGIGHLSTLFGKDDSPGCLMAGRAAFPAESADVIAKSAAILSAEVLRAARR